MQREKVHGAGRSSFGLVDHTKVFNELRLRRGITFLDLGCGRGEYAIAASKIIGDNGLVYGIDLWEDGIAFLQEEISAKGIKNLKPVVADIGKRLPIGDGSVHICFMATVFHELVLADASEGALKEVVRVLKGDGCLAILDFKKIDGPPGPPLTSRLTPEEVEKTVTPYGFRKEGLTETGPYTYLITFYSQ